MDGGLLNSLVGDYLASLGSKLAEKFKKETKATPLPPGSPGLAEMVKHFSATSPAKRKLNITNGDSPAKKSKKDESSSDDDSSDEEEETKPAAKAPAPAKVEKMEEDSSSDDDSDEEEEKKPAAKKATPAKAAPKAAAKKEESSDDDSSDDDEEEEVKKPAAKPAAKAAAKKEESSDDDDSSDEEEEKPAAKKATPAKAAAKKEESSDDDDSDSDEEEKPAAKKAPAKAEAKKEDSDDSDDSSDDDEEEAPAKEAEPEMKITNNKNKSFNESPQKSHNTSHNQSFGNKSMSEEGRKIFIHNVSEESTYENFQESVEKFGEVTDFFNPGRGFAFITFSTNEEANACIAAMDNTEVAGRTIQMNIAKPKGDRGGNDRGGRGGGRGRGGGGGGGRREEVEGAKLFVHNVSEETGADELKKAFGKHGTITDAYNPGKGFAFVTFSTPDEAQAAISAMNGTNVCGRDIDCNIAKPRGDRNGGGGGGRGGGGRGGGRGRGGRGGGRGGRGGLNISVGGGGGGNRKTFD